MLCESPFFIAIDNYTISYNTSDIPVIIIDEKDFEKEPAEPEILYSGAANALFRRRPYQFILLNAINDKLSKDLFNNSEVIVREGAISCQSRTIRFEYAVKTRKILEPLDTLQSIIEDGYPFFTSLRARLYEHKNKSIKKLIPKEERTILACILVREEDYEQLERYAQEKLPINDISPVCFRPFQPTPLFYASMNLIWGTMKDPQKMLRWLVNHGADINKPSGEKLTPLGNQCFANGSIAILKSLLDAGADPNALSYLNDIAVTPMELIAPIINYREDPDFSAEEKKQIEEYFTPEQIENLRKKADLLREYSTKEQKEKPRSIPSEITEKEFIIFDVWTEVADWQFARDRTHTSFLLGDNITAIGKCAFAHCEKLNRIDIGKNVKIIGKFAFRKDNRPGEMADISVVINRSVKPQIINKYHFYNNDLSKAVLRVPEQSLQEYRQAEGWKEFGSIVALDEINYPNPDIQLNKNKKTTNIKKRKEVPLTVHVWLGNFKSKKDLDEYADNSEYEWEYYGHLLGEDNFDEPPEEYGLGCAFCSDNGFMYEEAADITDSLFWKFYKKNQSLHDILSTLPIDAAEVLDVCKEKYPKLEKVNSYIILFGYYKKEKFFLKMTLSKNLFYLGEFEMPQEDTDGQYEAWN